MSERVPLAIWETLTEYKDFLILLYQNFFDELNKEDYKTIFSDIKNIGQNPYTKINSKKILIEFFKEFSEEFEINYLMQDFPEDMINTALRLVNFKDNDIVELPSLNTSHSGILYLEVPEKNLIFKIPDETDAEEDHYRLVPQDQKISSSTCTFIGPCIKLNIAPCAFKKIIIDSPKALLHINDLYLEKNSPIADLELTQNVKTCEVIQPLFCSRDRYENWRFGAKLTIKNPNLQLSYDTKEWFKILYDYTPE